MRARALRFAGPLAAPLAVTMALACGGCSFHPLYARSGPDAAGQTVFHSIYVEPIAAERAGYELRDSLMDLLAGADQPSHAVYRLSVKVRQTVEGIAVQTNASITHYSYTLIADYELTNIRTGASITKGMEKTVSAYDVVASPYATLVAQQDAQKQGAHDIAGRIRIDLGVYFVKHPGG